MILLELAPGFSADSIRSQFPEEMRACRAVSYSGSNWLVCPQSDWLARHVNDRVGIARILVIRLPYPVASTQFASKRTLVRVGPVTFGTGDPVLIAGPCSVESQDQMLTVADHLAKNGCQMLRGGAFKPRTSPYSFQGLGKAGLELLAEARRKTGLPFVTEVLSPADVALVSEYADMLQIGARNMQNFPLLREVGRSGKPVLLKRAPWADLTTWLQAAEYILVEGNFQVVLCERGITASQASDGPHLDLSGVRKLRSLTHLPVIVDPSHGSKVRELVIPMAVAAATLGVDGLMVEVHASPDLALSDGDQSLRLSDFDDLISLLSHLRDWQTHKALVG